MQSIHQCNETISFSVKRMKYVRFDVRFGQDIERGIHERVSTLRSVHFAIMRELMNRWGGGVPHKRSLIAPLLTSHQKGDTASLHGENAQILRARVAVVAPYRLSLGFSVRNTTAALPRSR